MLHRRMDSADLNQYLTARAEHDAPPKLGLITGNNPLLLRRRGRCILTG